MNYTATYIGQAVQILQQLEQKSIDRILELLLEVKARSGRIFFLGVGGGAGHASHAVNDFRKIAGIEAYAPTDNVSELTARVNDDGWETSFANWLRGSHLNSHDMVFVFSVGGGDFNVTSAPTWFVPSNTPRRWAPRFVVSSDVMAGSLPRLRTHVCIVPVIDPETVTPHTESFQALVWHLLGSHPRLKAAEMKWESTH